MGNTAKKYEASVMNHQSAKLLALPKRAKNVFLPSAPVPAIRRQLKYLHNLTAALFVSGVLFQIVLTAFALASMEVLGPAVALVLELIGFSFSVFTLACGFFVRWVAINVDSCLHDVRHLVYRK